MDQRLFFFQLALDIASLVFPRGERVDHFAGIAEISLEGGCLQVEQVALCTKRTQARRNHQRGRRGRKPEVFLAPEAFFDDRFGQEVRSDRRPIHRLGRETIRHAKPLGKFGKRRGRRGNLLELIDPFDSHVQVLLEILLHPGQLESIAHPDELHEAGIAMQRGVIANRALNIQNQFRKHRPHDLEDLAGVFALGGGTFEFFRLGERKFEALNEGLGKVIAANVDRSRPDAIAICDDKVGLVRSDVGEDRCPIEAGLPVGEHEVVERQRSHLHQIDIQPCPDEIGEHLGDVDLLHRKNADFDFR